MVRNEKQFQSVLTSNKSLNSSMMGSQQDLNWSLPNVREDRIKNEMISGGRKYPWGFEGYRAPLTITSATFEINGGKFSKSKLNSFIDEIKKSKEHLPSAIKYNKINDWSKIILGDKGKFLRTK